MAMSWSPSFREQIYELLEQSKVVHQVKDKEKRKTLTMTKDLQQILANNEKRVKEDKWDNDAKELRDLISKQQKRIEKEKEDEKCKDDLLQGKFKHFKGCLTTDGKDVKTGSSQKSIKDIITDLVDSLRFHKKNMEQVSDDYYEYDRNRFVSRYYDRDRDLDLNYSTDLESLATLIVQIHKYNHIIITDGAGKDIRTNQIIDERLEDEI
jgi:hypothetical protein